MRDEELIKVAKDYSKNSYSPYSNFQVGAALLLKDGTVFGGCNIENHGIQSLCSERTAFVKAISENKRDFIKIAVVARKKGGKFESTLPCGYCRQFMSEFCNKEFEIITYDESKNKMEKYTLEQLLPFGFSL